jgi:hypothetical protein
MDSPERSRWAASDWQPEHCSLIILKKDIVQNLSRKFWEDLNAAVIPLNFLKYKSLTTQFESLFQDTIYTRLRFPLTEKLSALTLKFQIFAMFLIFNTWNASFKNCGCIYDTFYCQILVAYVKCLIIITIKRRAQFISHLRHISFRFSRNWP